MAEELSFTEGWIMGELLKLSQKVVDFAARTLGADIEQAGPSSIEDEFRLGSRLVELGTVIQARATERRSKTNDSTRKE